jgi:hypothetical protein
MATTDGAGGAVWTGETIVTSGFFETLDRALAASSYRQAGIYARRILRSAAGRSRHFAE